MTPTEILEMAAETDEPIIVYEEYEQAIIGITDSWGIVDTETGMGAGHPYRLVYSYEKCVDILMKDHGMTAEEAEEHMSYNTCGAYNGPHTPIIVYGVE